MGNLFILFFGIFMVKINGDNSIKFNRTYMLFVPEDAQIGHTQLIDTLDLSFCSIKSPLSHNKNLPFEILLTSDENCTLNLYVIDQLDREKISIYTTEQELIYKNLSIFIHLSIFILDVNDHIPEFEKEYFRFSVKENILPGTFIGRVQAYDKDSSFNGRISYTLYGDDLIQSNNRIMFRIDKDTGEIFLFDYILDYEKKHEYKIIVEAKDYGGIETNNWPSLSSYIDVIITVEDVNDEKPEIIFIIPDEDKIRIMNISKPELNKEQNYFIMSFRSTINLLENDAEMIYLAKVEPLSATSLLGILHLRDHDQISNGNLSLDLQTYVPCSTEESKISFCQVSNFIYLSVFRTNVYGLFTSRILDREGYENYIVHLTANDNNLFYSELFIYLTLLDINDNIPIFNQTYFHIKIDENQPKNTILTRLYAYDIDKGRNGTVRYEILNKNQRIFSIDKYSGILRTRRKLDREQCELYRIGIRAYDLGYPKRKYSSIVIVDIEINNINDNIPYFMHDTYHFYIEENAPIEKIVGKLTIGDRDEQEPIEQMINLSTIEDKQIPQFNLNNISRMNDSKIDYLFVDSLRNESLSGLFSIDSQGFIHTLVILDREIQSNYSFYIYIYDPMLKSYSLPTYIIIQILDENDNIPFEPHLSQTSILSIEQVNNEETIIYNFKPIDFDDGFNGLVSIECLNCTSMFYFHMINSSILITRPNITVPDGIYTLSFILRDHGVTISHKNFYTLTFNLTHRSKSNKEEKLYTRRFIFKDIFSGISWEYFISFIIIWLVLIFIISWVCYYYDKILIKKRRHQQKRNEIIPDYRNVHNNNLANNLNSIAIQNQSTQILYRSIHFSQLHNTCQRLSPIMNSKDTILTDAATNTSYHDDNNDIWQAMNSNNNNRISYDNASTILHNKNYHFQPIDQDFSSISTASPSSNHSNLIQRPIPISNHRSNTSLQQHTLQTKRNSTVNINSSDIDTTIRSYVIPRSITTDQIAITNSATNRLYYFPSVQDVLDALNRRSFDKESFV